MEPDFLKKKTVTVREAKGTIRYNENYAVVKKPKVNKELNRPLHGTKLLYKQILEKEMAKERKHEFLHGGYPSRYVLGLQGATKELQEKKTDSNLDPSSYFESEIEDSIVRSQPLSSEVWKEASRWPVPSDKLRRRISEIAKALEKNDGSLIRLRLHSEGVNDELLSVLCEALPKNKFLQSLMLHDNAISDKGIEQLSVALMNHPSMRILCIGDNYVSDDGVLSICRGILAYNSQLSDLNIANRWPGRSWMGNEQRLHPYLSAIGAGYISQELCKGHCSLTSLSLQHQRINDEGAIALFQALPHCNLRTLNLRSNGLTSKCCEALRDTLSANVLLEQLILSHNDICDEGAVQISHGLLKNVFLMALDVGVNMIGDRGMQALLACLQRNHTLYTLSTYRNKSSDDRAEVIVNARMKQAKKETEFQLQEQGAQGNMSIMDLLDGGHHIGAHNTGVTGAVAAFGLHPEHHERRRRPGQGEGGGVRVLDGEGAPAWAGAVSAAVVNAKADSDMKDLRDEVRADAEKNKADGINTRDDNYTEQQLGDEGVADIARQLSVGDMVPPPLVKQKSLILTQMSRLPPNSIALSRAQSLRDLHDSGSRPGTNSSSSKPGTSNRPGTGGEGGRGESAFATLSRQSSSHQLASSMVDGTSSHGRKPLHRELSIGNLLVAASRAESASRSFSRSYSNVPSTIAGTATVTGDVSQLNEFGDIDLPPLVVNRPFTPMSTTPHSTVCLSNSMDGGSASMEISPSPSAIQLHTNTDLGPGVGTSSMESMDSIGVNAPTPDPTHVPTHVTGTQLVNTTALNNKMTDANSQLKANEGKKEGDDDDEEGGDQFGTMVEGSHLSHCGGSSSQPNRPTRHQSMAIGLGNNTSTAGQQMTKQRQSADNAKTGNDRDDNVSTTSSDSDESSSQDAPAPVWKSWYGRSRNPNHNHHSLTAQTTNTQKSLGRNPPTKLLSQDVGKSTSIPKLGHTGSMPIRTCTSEFGDSGNHLMYLRMSTAGDYALQQAMEKSQAAAASSKGAKKNKQHTEEEHNVHGQHLMFGNDKHHNPAAAVKHHEEEAKKKNDARPTSILQIARNYEKAKAELIKYRQTNEYKMYKKDLLAQSSYGVSKQLAAMKPPPDYFWKDWRTKMHLMYPEGIDKAPKVYSTKIPDHIAIAQAAAANRATSMAPGAVVSRLGSPGGTSHAPGTPSGEVSASTYLKVAETKKLFGEHTSPGEVIGIKRKERLLKLNKERHMRDEQLIEEQKEHDLMIYKQHHRVSDSEVENKVTMATAQQQNAKTNILVSFSNNSTKKQL